MQRWCAAALTMAVSQALVAGPDYTFTLIADSQDPAYMSFGGGPSINSAGHVAFMAHLTNGERAVYWGDGGPLHLIADHSGPLSHITDFQIVSIADTDQVAFRSVLDLGGLTIVRGDGGPLTTIAQTDGTFQAVNNPTINAHDDVAFSATLHNGDQNVYVGDGGVPTLILDGAGPYQPYASTYYPDLNDAGTVGVIAEKDPGNLEFDILKGDNNAMNLLYSAPSNDYHWFQDWSLAMNNLGTVQFGWYNTNIGYGVSTGDGGPTNVVAVTGDPVVPVNPGQTAISGVGRSVFSGSPLGIYTGNQLSDCVLAVGDQIFGREVETLRMSQDCINDAGQIGLIVKFTDNSWAVVRADPTSPCAPLPDNAVLWTKFDETVGPTAANAIGGNDGLHVGATFVINDGAVGNALEFFGNNGYVNVPNYPAIEIGEGDLSIDAWVRVTDFLQGDRRIVDKRGLNDALNEVGYSLFTRFGELGVRLANGGGGGGFTDYMSGFNIPPDFEWHLVAVTVDRDDPNGIRFYLDGAQVGLPQDPTNRQGTMANSLPLRIGASTIDGTDAFYGSIDEVEVFSRALDADEIQAIFNAGAAGKCPSHCVLPWDVPMCKNDDSVSVTGYICNLGTTPETYHYSFSGLPEPICGNINGPATFTPFGGTVTVAPGDCEPVTFTVARPVQMTQAYLISCFEMAVLAESTGEIATCRGPIEDRRDICTGMPKLVAVELGVGALVPVTLTNTSDELIELNYEFAVYDHHMEPDANNISLDGLPPGVPVAGSIKLPVDTQVQIELFVDFVQFNPAHPYSLVMQVPQGQVGAGALASSVLMNVIEPTCPADCNADGALNILDFVCFQNQFTSGDTAADCDDSGELNILDFVCFQGLFTAGCP